MTIGIAVGTLDRQCTRDVEGIDPRFELRQIVETALRRTSEQSHVSARRAGSRPEVLPVNEPRRSPIISKPFLSGSREGSQDHCNRGRDRRAGRRAGTRHPRRPRQGVFGPGSDPPAGVRTGSRARRARRRDRGGGSRSPRDADAHVRGRRRRLLRHEFLGASLSRAGARAGRRDGSGGEGRRRRARHLVNARRRQTVGAARERPDADPDGSLQSPALRCKRRSQRGVRQPEPAGDVPVDLVLLGQFHQLPRYGFDARARTACSHCACRWATRNCPASRPKTSGGVRTAFSGPATAMWARPSASPASI